MWIPPTLPSIDQNARAAADERQGQLTKPPGALGRLEQLATQIAGIQGRARPQAERFAVIVCAADHGVVAQGVSAFPAEVTAAMCANFCAGGAAVNVLAEQLGASVTVLDVGVAADLPEHPSLVSAKISRGTADFTQGPAMSVEECAAALDLGRKQARQAAAGGVEVLIPGEMGIGNTTSAAALMAAGLDLNPERCVGRGTGVDDAGLERKVTAVAAALAVHQHELNDPFERLRRLGGLEIAAMAGLMIGAAEQRLVVLVDGFIATAAAASAIGLAPAVADFLVFGHCSAEQAHARWVSALGGEPLLDLGMRLGEGSGAVLAGHLLRAATRSLDRMATFAEAGVAGGG